LTENSTSDLTKNPDQNGRALLPTELKKRYNL
jgi:hypothetical protein